MISKNRLPGVARVALAVGRVTFSEILRDKILYNILLIALLLLFLAFLGSQLSFMGSGRIVLDFGVTAISLSSALLGAFLGSSALNREFERRTIHLALSRPISRAQFVMGKFLGVVMVLTLNWLLLGAVFLLLSFAFELGAEIGLVDRLRGTLTPALFLLLIQGWLVAAISIAFSTYSSTIVSFLLAIGVFLIGNSVSALKAVAAHWEGVWFHRLLPVVTRVVPNFEYLNLKEWVTYDLPTPEGYLVRAAGYCFVWIGLCLLVASLLVRTKES